MKFNVGTNYWPSKRYTYRKQSAVAVEQEGSVQKCTFQQQQVVAENLQLFLTSRLCENTTTQSERA